MRTDATSPNDLNLEEIERKENGHLPKSDKVLDNEKKENGHVQQSESNNIPTDNEIKVDKNQLASEAFSTLLDRVGGYGKWQWKLLFITSFCGNFTAFHNLGAGKYSLFVESYSSTLPIMII